MSLLILTEIFINRTFNGEKLEDNIRLIGACNPYRQRKENIERYGLTREDDEDDKFVYKVEQLPQSLLYYVFSFGALQDENEKKYIKSIIQKLFTKEEEEKNLHDYTTEAISKCHQFLRKSFGDDPSVVSLREIARFTKCVEFFQDYFLKKDNFLNNKNISEYSLDDETKKLYKIKSIICSIYICYYIRLTSDNRRLNFENNLQEILLLIANAYCPENEENQSGNLLSKLRFEKLKEEIRDKNFKQFSELLRLEEEFLLDKVDLDEGIGKNKLIKENLFLLFLAVVTKIPLIIVGKPGTGKSLSAQLIYNSMRGKYSKSKKGKKSFFINYPKITQIYFQGSTSTTPEDIEELFKKADNLNKHSPKRSGDLAPTYTIFFDELGLAEKSKSNPLKVIHNKLEYTGKTEGTCFIGISNYSLDAAKTNRALNLSVPNLEDKLDQLKETAQSIIKSIFVDNYQENTIFDLLSRAYSEYKAILIFIKQLIVLKQYYINKVAEEVKKDEKKFKRKEFNEITKDPEFIKLFKRKEFDEITKDPEFIKLFKTDKQIKTEFHGNRDFYNLIKGVAIEVSKLGTTPENKNIVEIINKCIERNFGGITYDIDIDFNLEFGDIQDRMKILKEKILNEKLNNIKKVKKINKSKNANENKTIKVPSVYLFKKIFNQACDNESKSKENLDLKSYQIPQDKLLQYNVTELIKDNINDNKCRYLLLEIRANIAPLIIQIIRNKNSYRDDKDNIKIINGSPFSDDINNDYKAEKVGEILYLASQKDKLIILQNLDQIQPYLYDLYNMNYKIIDGQKFVRICLDNTTEQLAPVDDTFKIIVLADKKFVNKIDMAFLNRLEKMQISFNELLEQSQKELVDTIIKKQIRLKDTINNEKNKFNYDLNNLLINCSEQDIGGLVYYLSLEAEKKK